MTRKFPASLILVLFFLMEQICFSQPVYYPPVVTYPTDTSSTITIITNYMATNIVAITNGGTGATNAADARANLGITNYFFYDTNENSWGGENALASALGTNNVGVGWAAGLGHTGSRNTIVGALAGTNTVASDLTAVGHNALRMSVVWGTAVGSGALETNSTGYNNVAVGYKSINGNSTGDYNVGVGDYALSGNNMDGNTAVGHQSMYKNGGSYNTAIGMGSMISSASQVGTYNVAIGDNAYQDGSGTFNSAIGSDSQYGQTGSYNTSVGGESMWQGSGSRNTALGYRSLYNTSTASDNVAIGVDSGHSATGHSNVFIGPTAGYLETGSHKLYIANRTNVALITGDFETNSLTINSNLQITGAITLVGDPATSRVSLGITGSQTNVVLQSEYGTNNWVAVFGETNSLRNSRVLYSHPTTNGIGIATTEVTNALNIGGDGTISATGARLNLSTGGKLVAIDGGLHVGDTTDPGDNNLQVKGTINITGNSTLQQINAYGIYNCYLNSTMAGNPIIRLQNIGGSLSNAWQIGLVQTNSFGELDKSHIYFRRFNEAGTAITPDVMILRRDTGYVGIGTTNATQQLTVAANISAGGTGYFGGALTCNSYAVINSGVVVPNASFRTTAADAGTPLIYLQTTITSNKWAIGWEGAGTNGTMDRHHMNFRRYDEAGTLQPPNVMTLRRDTGHVGIGTTNATEQLTVATNILAGGSIASGSTNGLAGSSGALRMNGWGGLDIHLTNGTGAASVLGNIVRTSLTNELSVQLTETESDFPVGVMAESGIASGSLVWVTISGRAQVLLTDGKFATNGGVAITSTAVGRGEAEGVGVPAEHDQEIGHSLQSVGPGTDVLAWVLLHFR